MIAMGLSLAPMILNEKALRLGKCQPNFARSPPRSGGWRLRRVRRLLTLKLQAVSFITDQRRRYILQRASNFFSFPFFFFFESSCKFGVTSKTFVSWIPHRWRREQNHFVRLRANLEIYRAWTWTWDRASIVWKFQTEQSWTIDRSVVVWKSVENKEMRRKEEENYFESETLFSFLWLVSCTRQSIPRASPEPC